MGALSIDFGLINADNIEQVCPWSIEHLVSLLILKRLSFRFRVSRFPTSVCYPVENNQSSMLPGDIQCLFLRRHGQETR